MNTDNLRKLYKGGLTILIFCTLLECLFHFAIENINGCLVMIYGWILWGHYVFKRDNLINFCLPTLAVTGYIFMYFFLPLIITLIEGKPLTFKFEVPYLFWFNLFINVTVIIAAFSFSKRRFHQSNFLHRIWTKIGFYHIPKEREIWTLAILGLVALLYNVVTRQGDDISFDEMQGNATGGFLGSIFSQLEVYACVPLFLFFKKYYGDFGKLNSRRLIIIYIVFEVALCIATTRRSIVAYPVLSICMIFLIYSIINGKKLLTFKKGILVCFGIYLITGPVVDLFGAMALARHKDFSKETLNEMIQLYEDKEKLHESFQYLSAFVNKDSPNNFGWSEYYVDNILLDRFCNLRVQDASLYYASKLGYMNTAMAEFTKDFVVFRIPTFLTNIMGEKKVVRTSPGDLFVEQYFHEAHHIGQKVAGDIGIGLYMLGYFYYPVAFILYFLLFYVLASLTRVKNGSLILNLFIMISFARYFMYFVNATGIFKTIGLLMRDIWINIIIYCLLLKFIKVFSFSRR